MVRSDQPHCYTDFTNVYYLTGELSTTIDVDNEADEVRKSSKIILEQELGFSSHLGIPAILVYLTKPKNLQLARIINDKLISGYAYAVWVQVGTNNMFMALGNLFNIANLLDPHGALFSRWCHR